MFDIWKTKFRQQKECYKNVIYWIWAIIKGSIFVTLFCICSVPLAEILKMKCIQRFAIDLTISRIETVNNFPSYSDIYHGWYCHKSAKCCCIFDSVRQTFFSPVTEWLIRYIVRSLNIPIFSKICIIKYFQPVFQPFHTLLLTTFSTEVNIHVSETVLDLFKPWNR